MDREFVGHFSWLQFALIALLYTLAPILSSARWGKYRDIQDLLTAVKAAPLFALKIHLIFLSALLAIFWIPAHYYSDLPGWLKGSTLFGQPIPDWAVLLILILMIATEERILRANSEPR